MHRIRMNQKWISMVLLLALVATFFCGAAMLLENINTNADLPQKSDMPSQSLHLNFSDILGFNPLSDLLLTNLSKNSLEELKQTPFLVLSAINYADRTKYKVLFIFFSVFILSILRRMRMIVNFIHKMDGHKGICQLKN